MMTAIIMVIMVMVVAVAVLMRMMRIDGDVVTVIVCDDVVE